MSGFIEVYTIPSCPECSQVKYALQKNGLYFREIDLVNRYVNDDDYHRFEQTRTADGRLQVPAIFVNNKFLGGRVELAMYLKSLDRTPAFVPGNCPPLRTVPQTQCLTRN